jgi:hypothetical protein
VVAVPALVAELLAVAVVVREAAVPSSPRWRWSAWSRCRRGRGAGVDLVVAELGLAVVVVVREAAVPSSPRPARRGGGRGAQLAAVVVVAGVLAVAAVVAELVLAVVALDGGPRRSCSRTKTAFFIP